MFARGTTLLVLTRLIASCKAQTLTFQDVPSLASDPTLTAFDEKLYNSNTAFCYQFGNGNDIGFYDAPDDNFHPVHIACGDKSQFPTGTTTCDTPAAGSVAAVAVQTLNYGFLNGFDDKTTTKYVCTTQACPNARCGLTPEFHYLNSNACNPQDGEQLVIYSDSGEVFGDCAQTGTQGTATKVPVPAPLNGHGLAAVISGTYVLDGRSPEETIVCDAGFMPVGDSCILAASQVPRQIKRGRYLKRNAPLPGF